MRWLALTLMALPAVAQAQTAAVPAPGQTAQGDVSVTIYNNDLALVQDTRTLTLPSSRIRQEFADVSASIRPETVTVSGSGLTVVEQNFDYDLLSPAKLMEKAVGTTVTLVRRNAAGVETTEQAKILANNGGTVIQIGNRIEILEQYGARVIFPTLPPNLRARPTLSVTFDSSSAGARPVTLNYLSRGLGWKADYVALFDDSAGKIDVQGWITLTNNSGTTFSNARTLLVAGAVGGGNSGRPSSRPYYNGNQSIPGNRPGTQTAPREQLGDFYIYPLAERTTIAQAQQKQVSFLDVAGAPAARGYFYRNQWLGSLNEAVSFDTVLRFSSSREGGLGDALPAGSVRVYMRDARGQPQFIGESAIPHTPMGSSLALKTGEAFDVKVKPTVEKREALGRDRWRTTMRYTITNARSTPVTVDLAQSGLDSYWDDTRIESESQKSERVSSDETMWKVTVPANGEATVTAVFLTRF
ncbi:DUF4139 domain-containing protein [Sphingomonas sp. AOB5]|uniref:DUF4139 domain-containing protein n=1 Tax=Sphingomonas sp. AOB5 TaxID=3034017 RepID=UPI0023F98CD3|nr:DUF4139 domain-containing protein [Sphingomonas sp. AOB5]MDF7774751.1 DUF4139 domain-containing protein [Sphingomonas sp. AOB5]